MADAHRSLKILLLYRAGAFRPLGMMTFLMGVLVGLLIFFVFTGTALAHTPDWVSHLLEWLFGKKAAVGEAPSAGWMEPKPSPDFRLVDQDGRAIALLNLRGKVVLMNFIYSGCGDHCSSIKELKILARALGGRMREEVVFVSITLDPERDTAETLKAFSQRREIGSGWKLLTGPSDAIEKLVRAYGVYFKKIEASHRNTHRSIEYADVILFFDQEGRLMKRVFPHLLQLSGRADVEWLLEGHNH
ncbi:MAG: SCO family protein [Candidatus Binatia bacterium]|nr:SCO family protein [Candidatus Binatia bacterium]